MANAPKKKRGKKRDIAADPIPHDYEMIAIGDGDGEPSIDDASISVPTADGTVTVNLNPMAPAKKSSKFNDNLAEYLDEGELGRISTPLLDGIDEDIQGRQDWLQQRTDGLDLLGLKMTRPGTGNVGSSATAVPGQSTVRDPIMAQAVLRGQANAYAELCPSGGPCKAVNFGEETEEADELAEELEKDFNYYFTNTASEYYPDYYEMLGWTVYASGMFRKVYTCPIRRRPVSESVDGADLIIPANVTDLKNSARVTHQINMRQSVMRRMQLLGVYRDVSLTLPTPEPNALDLKVATLSGLDATPQRPEDQDYTVYECYCELDIPGFEHKEEGDSEPSGLPLPYRVTLDKDSRTILEIRRNWREEDPDQKAKIPFVGFPYVRAPGTGIYGAGQLHILGNITMALTAMLRESIDAGMYANFPGGLIAASATRQKTNEIRVAPGSLAPIDIGGLQDITKAVMPLPYKDVTPGLISLQQMLVDRGGQLGGTAESPVGEGKQDAPVGTTLALIEQATKIEAGVHKGFHAAQAEEFRLFKDLFAEDPSALWRGNRRPAMGKDMNVRLAKFTKALQDCELVPMSDPNVPSHMHRIMKANSYLQTAMAMSGVFNMQNVVKRWASMVQIDGVEADFAPAQQEQPNPLLLKLQVDKQNADTKAQEVQAKVELGHAQIQSKEQIEATKIAAQHMVGPQPQDTGNKVKETLTYKDAPPDIQRQIEAQAGLVPSQATSPDEQGDPMQAQALNLKQQQVHQSGLKMVLDAHNAHADRQSREGIEAIKLAQAEAVHPTSAPVVDRTLDQMSAFMKPAAQQETPPMSDGGSVGDRHDAEDARAAKLAALITQFLQEQSQSGYQH